MVAHTCSALLIAIDNISTVCDIGLYRNVGKKGTGKKGTGKMGTEKRAQEKLAQEKRAQVKN